MAYLSTVLSAAATGLLNIMYIVRIHTIFLVYVFNFVDRQILAIFAEEIKADIGVTDAQLGFLFGIAFAVFYATFGVAFGRLADTWNRKKLITLGLGFWSLMTALSGLARGFVPLAVCRFGIGAGRQALPRQPIRCCMITSRRRCGRLY